MIGRVMEYCQKMNHRADWIPILTSLLQRQPGGPDQAMNMAIKLATNPGGPMLDVNAAGPSESYEIKISKREVA